MGGEKPRCPPSLLHALVKLTDQMAYEGIPTQVLARLLDVWEAIPGSEGKMAIEALTTWTVQGDLHLALRPPPFSLESLIREGCSPEPPDSDQERRSEC